MTITREQAQKDIKGQLNMDIDILEFDDQEISKLIWILKQIK